jgi:hypothetical protein
MTIPGIADMPRTNSRKYAQNGTQPLHKPTSAHSIGLHRPCICSIPRTSQKMAYRGDSPDAPIP